MSLVGVFDAHAGDPRSRQVASSVDFSPDGATIATAGEDQVVRLWETDGGALRGELRGHTHHISSLAFNPVSGVLASGDWDGVIRFWDVGAGTQVGQIDMGDTVTGLEFTADGSALAVSAGWRVEVFDAATRSLRWLETLANTGVEHVAISPDGSRVAVVTNATDADGRDVFTGYLWELPSGRLVAELVGHTDHSRGMAFSPDSTQLITTGFDRRVLRFQAVTGERIESRVDNDGGVNAVAFSPDGRYYVLADGWGPVVRDAQTGDRVATGSAFASEAWWVAYSPDGTKIAAVSWNGELAVWSITST